MSALAGTALGLRTSLFFDVRKKPQSRSKAPAGSSACNQPWACAAAAVAFWPPSACSARASRATPLVSKSAIAAASAVGASPPVGSPSPRRSIGSMPSGLSPASASAWLPSRAMTCASRPSPLATLIAARSAMKSGSSSPCSIAAVSKRRRSSVLARSSSVAKPGVTPASIGKLAINPCAKAWMVCTASPCGASSTSANRRRAMASTSGPASVRSAARSLVSSAALHRAQCASRPNTRVCISAAASLVKVRHKIACGGVPCSNSRNTRADSTWVLPVPADAVTQACACGSAALACSGLRICRAETIWLMRRRRVWAGPAIPPPGRDDRNRSSHSRAHAWI